MISAPTFVLTSSTTRVLAFSSPPSRPARSRHALSLTSQSCSPSPPSPSGSSCVWFGPATYPSTEVAMWALTLLMSVPPETASAPDEEARSGWIGLASIASVVPHTGFEPVISALRGRCPGPLDECGPVGSEGAPAGRHLTSDALGTSTEAARLPSMSDQPGPSQVRVVLRELAILAVGLIMLFVVVGLIVYF